MDFVTFALLAIGSLSVFLIIAVLVLTRHGARHLTIRVLLFTRRGASQVLAQADLERLSSKIAKLENEINRLKVELVSTRTRPPKFAASTQEDTWTRSEGLLSIVPTITEPVDSDTWDRNEGSDTFEPVNSDALLSLSAPAEQAQHNRDEKLVAGITKLGREK